MAKAALSVSRAALLDEGSDSRFRQMIQDMLGVAARMQALREKLAGFAGVSGPQYSLLFAIFHLSGAKVPVTITRLAAHLHISTTYVTAETGRLVEAGLVTKKPNPRDGRSVCLMLTAKGEDCLAKLMPVVRLANDEIFRALDREGFVGLSREMAEMVRALDDALLLVAHMQREKERG